MTAVRYKRCMRYWPAICVCSLLFVAGCDKSPEISKPKRGGYVRFFNGTDQPLSASSGTRTLCTDVASGTFGPSILLKPKEMPISVLLGRDKWEGKVTPASGDLTTVALVGDTAKPRVQVFTGDSRITRKDTANARMLQFVEGTYTIEGRGALGSTLRLSAPGDLQGGRAVTVDPDTYLLLLKRDGRVVAKRKVEVVNGVGWTAAIYLRKGKPAIAWQSNKDSTVVSAQGASGF